MSITEIESTGLIRTIMPMTALMDPADTALPDTAQRVALAALAMTASGLRPASTQLPSRSIKASPKLRRLAKPSGDYRATAKGRKRPADDEDEHSTFSGLL